MSKSILIITPFPPNGIGGAETFVKALIKEAKKENKVYLCTLKARKKAWKGLAITKLFSTFPLLLLKGWWMTRRNKIDVIHAQGLIAGLIAVHLRAWFRLKCKIYVTLLALYEFEKWGETIQKKYARMIFEYSDLVFVEGDNGLKDLVGLYIGNEIRADIDEKMLKELLPKTRTFNHWVDQDVFKPEESKTTDKIKVLFIGRPIPEKGRHIVEEAERLINDPERFEFIYVDNVPHEELPKYYQMAHILVCPSLYAEGYVRVVAEGASCGCAIITSDRGSLPEQVNGWGTTYDGTPTGLIEALHNYKIGIDGENAYTYAKNNFNPKNSGVFLDEYKR